MYRTIQTETWDDPWFADLAPNAKLLFLFLITNRRVNQCGAMEITMRQISFETGLPAATIPGLIESFGDRIKWWPDHQILIIRNFYRHQRANTGDKFDIAATKSAESLPDFAKSWVYGVYPHLAPAGYTHPIPTPVPTDTHGVSGQDSNRTVTEQKQSSPLTPQGESVEFVNFYTEYPRHTARQDAWKAWQKIKPTPDVVEEIMTGMRRLIPDYRSREPDKVPHPATFLNGRRWNDEPVKAAGVKEYSPYRFTREEELAAIAANPLMRVVSHD